MKRAFFFVVLLQSLCLLMASADGKNKLEFEKVFPKLKFDRPIAFVDLKQDSQFFVVEQWGRVYLSSLKDKSLKKEVLNINPRLSTKNEEGLLSLVLDPNFHENNYVYVYYSRKKPRRQSVVSRMTYKDGKIDSKTELIFLVIDQPYWNHNGGQLAFGTDKMLYIALGDGGAANDPHKHGQNKKTLHGNILRIDVSRKSGDKNYRVPQDNPFVGEKNIRTEIYAYGLRNPWRFSFDGKTQEIYCADVGQGKQEEVNVITKGGNYGWRVYEGDLDFRRKEKESKQKYIKPIFTYDRKKGVSVTGGYVFRGNKSAKYYGYYFCADYVTGHFFGVNTENKKSVDFGRYPFNPGSFAQDSQGNLYVCDYKNGNIFKMKL